MSSPGQASGRTGRTTARPVVDSNVVALLTFIDSRERADEGFDVVASGEQIACELAPLGCCLGVSTYRNGEAWMWRVRTLDGLGSVVGPELVGAISSGDGLTDGGAVDVCVVAQGRHLPDDSMDLGDADKRERLVHGPVGCGLRIESLWLV